MQKLQFFAPLGLGLDCSSQVPNDCVFSPNDQCKYPSDQVRKGFNKSLTQTVQPSNEQYDQDNDIKVFISHSHRINTIFY
jgi:hypothetical protein